VTCSRYFTRSGNLETVTPTPPHQTRSRKGYLQCWMLCKAQEEIIVEGNLPFWHTADCHLSSSNLLERLVVRNAGLMFRMNKGCVNRIIHHFPCASLLFFWHLTPVHRNRRSDILSVVHCRRWKGSYFCFCCHWI
jgi:hypothetical protein